MRLCARGKTSAFHLPSWRPHPNREKFCRAPWFAPPEHRSRGDGTTHEQPQSKWKRDVATERMNETAAQAAATADGLTLTSLQTEAKQGAEGPSKRARCGGRRGVVANEAAGEAASEADGGEASALGERKQRRERSRAEKGLPPKPRRARAERSTAEAKAGEASEAPAAAPAPAAAAALAPALALAPAPAPAAKRKRHTQLRQWGRGGGETIGGFFLGSGWVFLF